MSTFLPLLENISQLISKPSINIEPPPDLIEKILSAEKVLYEEIVKENHLTGLKSQALPTLLCDGFDDEQIWQQIELQNKEAIPHLRKFTSGFPNNINLGILDSNDLDSDSNLSSSNIPEAQKPSSSSDSGDEVNINVPKSILKKTASSKFSKSNTEKCASVDSEPSDDEEEENQQSESFKNRAGSKQQYKSIVDDQFFKLSKLEQFLRVEDLKEEKYRDGESMNGNDSEDEDGEDINIFEDIPSEDSNEEVDSEEESSNKKSSRNIMYEDFFDPPDSSEDLDPKQIDEDEDGIEEMDGSIKEDDESLDEEEVAGGSTKIKTPFELELEKIQQQCEDYEERMLKPAPWHLTGEVDVHKRPKDALLHLQTDFEMNSRPAVVEDKSLNEKLESLLKNAIKNKAFNDPVRQYKTNDEIIAKKKETFIEDTKSKKGLAQEYEDMYLKKKHGEIEEKNPKHVEIEKLMDSLFPQLYALFSHIPKPAVPDITVVSNLPAITVEDVAPTSVSDVTLLAPEEVKKRTGVIKGKTERTDVDRKRERRKKKLLQKEKQKKREKEIGEKPLSAKAKKQEKVDLIKKLRQQRNTKFAKVDGQKVKSSKDFFERLQETVSNTEGKKKKAKKT